MYSFKNINHGAILTHAVLVGLTPLIPIPFVDDWVKAIFMRRMVRQISGSRGQLLTNDEVEGLIQEDFWDGCLEGCLGILLRLLRELFSKVFFWIEWRRAVNLVSITYYTGFLLDAALLDGYALKATPGERSPQPATILREAIRRARHGANLKLIQRLIRPRDMLSAAWTLFKRSLVQLPRMLLALPGALWQAARSAPSAVARGVASFPRRARESFYLRVQVLLGRERAPEIQAVERLVQSMQAALLSIDPEHFDDLRNRLQEEISRATGYPEQPVERM